MLRINMNQSMFDIATPIKREELIADGIALHDIGFITDVDGFCNDTMTLRFRDNKHYMPHMLPDDTTPDSATTHALLTSSLSFVNHEHTIFQISDESLSKLYHVIDNPSVIYDKSLGIYRALRHHYIDRETMTGIIITSTSKSDGYSKVAGIFAPRGYGKIEHYNQFTNKYLERYGR